MENSQVIFRTRPFSMTRQQFFSLITKAYYRKRWLFFVGFPVFIAMMAILKPMGEDSQVLVWVGLIAVVAMVIPILQFWLFSGKSENEPLYQQQHVQFGEEEMVALYDNGAQRVMRYDGIVKASKASDHYVVRFRSNSFLYIPFSALESEADQQKFEQLISKK
jgi:hypothetical protein